MNTAHDEATIRATWRPTSDCLGGGLESRIAPKHGKPRDLLALSGTYDERNRRRAAGRKGTYR